MVGLDIAKAVCQAHGEDGAGRVVLQRRLGRAAVEKFFAALPPARIAMEACGSAHHWARVLRGMGHEVRLIPAAHVKPFVRRNKTDARDAAAICAAMRHPDLRTVPVKSVEQGCARGLERARDLLVRQRTQLANAMRGLLAEVGVIAPQGQRGLAQLAALIDAADAAIPSVLLAGVQALLAQWRSAAEAITALEKQLLERARADATMRRLMAIPGIGALSAPAIVAAISDGRQVRSARDFAAWVGLTPREHQSANKRRAGGISRQGDGGLRRPLVLGASAVMRQVKSRPERASAWQSGILARRPAKVAVVAQAAQNARVAWAMLTRGTTYRTGSATA
jgi:transposase